MSGQSTNANEAQLESMALMQLMQQREEEAKRQRVAAWIDTEYTRCKNARLPFERQWYINLSFTAGKQYVSPINIPGAGFRLTSPQAPPWRVRLVINKIRASVRIECSKLTSSKPIPTVLPSTNEDEDFSAARVGEAILKAYFADAEFAKTYRSWIWWGVTCGVSYLKEVWDGSAEDHDTKALPKIPSMPDGSQIPDHMIEQIKMENPEVKARLETPIPSKGKIKVDRITPFHMYVPDLLSEDLESQPYVIQVMTRSPSWVKRSFGQDVAADTKAATTIMEAATLISRGSEEHLDAVLVKEMWVKPGSHPDFPEGGVVTVAGGKVLQMTPKWPLPYPEYPYYKYDGVPTGGFYTDSSVSDLIPLQKEYNKARSQAIEIRNTMGKPRILYAKGSVNPRKISSEPGQSVEYIAGFNPPTVMPGVEVPASFSNEIGLLTEEFDDISGQHEISRGSTSSQVTSGTAIAFLLEQDDMRLTYQAASIEDCVRVLGKHYLQLASTYWEDDRVVKVTGKNDEFEALHWKRNALRGNTDVRIQAGSALPESKAAKQAFVTEQMMNGFIPPDVGLEMLNISSFEKVMSEMLVDKRQATRENIKMAEAPDGILKMLLEPAPGPNGEPPMEMDNPQPEMGGPPVQKFNGDMTPFQAKPPIPVNSWDNHEEHVRWHNHYRKGNEFEALSDYQKQAFELHVQMHQMAITANIVNMQRQMLQQNVEDPEVEEEEDPTEEYSEETTEETGPPPPKK